MFNPAHPGELVKERISDELRFMARIAKAPPQDRADQDRGSMTKD
jgi:hypothetical protein